MVLELSDLCLRSEGELDLIRQRTDSCASLGRSYELRCKLPPLCSPSEAMLGFCLTGKRYMLYIRPQVAYTGSSASLSELFSPGMRSFPTFRALTERMREWGQASIGSTALAQIPVPCQKIRAALEQQVIGQEEATEAAAYRLYTHISKKHPARPLSLILHGPTGTGKSELAKSIAPALNQLFPATPYQFIRVDLNTYTEAHSVARLVGAPPGYIGFDDQPIFEEVTRSERTVFLFDELEKAHSEVLKVFMAILDEGRYTAHKEYKDIGRELDFRRCIFLFTTNLDLSHPSAPPLGFGLPAAPKGDTPSVQELSLPRRLLLQDDLARQAMVRSGVLREIAGRFTGFLGFHSLDEASLMAITAKQVGTLGSEFGLRIVSIAPDIISALTPPEAFSIRSTIAALEGVLTPLFAEYRGAPHVHLVGTPDRMQLVAERRQAAGGA